MDDKRASEMRGRADCAYQIPSGGLWAARDVTDLLDALTTAQARIAELEAGRHADRVEWRCFHCDEVFTEKEAAEAHFGISECATPACKVSPDLAHVLRMQEEELYKHRQEQTEMGLLYYKFGAEHSTALRKAEQEGYDKGLADGRAIDAEATAREIGNEG